MHWAMLRPLMLLSRKHAPLTVDPSDMWMAWLSLRLRGMTVQHEYSVSEGTKHCIIFTASLTFLFPGSQCDMYNSELLLKVLGGFRGSSLLLVGSILQIRLCLWYLSCPYQRQIWNYSVPVTGFFSFITDITNIG